MKSQRLSDCVPRPTSETGKKADRSQHLAEPARVAPTIGLGQESSERGTSGPTAGLKSPLGEAVMLR